MSNGKAPDTPVSQKETVFYANMAAPEGSPLPRRASEQVGVGIGHVTAHVIVCVIM